MKSNMPLMVPAIAVERALSNPLATQPVVFDKAKNRALIGQRVVHVVVPSPGRDHHKRHAYAIATAPVRKSRQFIPASEEHRYHKDSCHSGYRTA